MFIGHFALGFAAKRAAPRASLGLLFAAAQLADLLWPVLVGAGIEQVRIDPGNTAFTPLDFVSYPYSHSLVLLLVWGAALAWLARVFGSDGRTSAVLCGLVVSHWMLDVLMHRPDIPLYPGGAKYGLGLWNSIPATLTIEFALFAVGLWVYAQTTRARDGTGRWAFIALAVLLVLTYVASFATLPPSVPAIWMGAVGGAAAILALSVWVDRHRAAR
jgi:membrane-bound metal-dependent hydrolase YbcI (DUF457 family)